MRTYSPTFSYAKQTQDARKDVTDTLKFLGGVAAAVFSGLIFGGPIMGLILSIAY